jgi:hypothetical protein
MYTEKRNGVATYLESRANCDIANPASSLLLECGIAGEGCLELTVVNVLVETNGNKCSWAPWLDIRPHLTLCHIV